MTLLVRSVLGMLFPVVTKMRSLYRWLRRPVTIGVRALIVQDEQIVLVRTHGSDVWDVPGGGVKRGETLRMAAIREAKEETGCSLAAGYVLGIYLNVHDNMSNHVAVFVCTPRTAPSVRLNLEIAEARSWPLAALPPTVPDATRRRLTEYQAGKRDMEGDW